MSAANKEDRKTIGEFTKVASGSGQPARIKDASESTTRPTTGKWSSAPAVPIRIPSSSWTTARTVASGPYGGDRLHSTIKPKIGKVNHALAFSNPPPSKRQKIDAGPSAAGPSRSRKKRVGSGSSPTRKSHAPVPLGVVKDGDEPILVEDDSDEDRGVPVSPAKRSSPDPLNLFGPGARGQPHPFDDVGESDDRIDGKLTKQYRGEFTRQTGSKATRRAEVQLKQEVTYIDSDPITDFDTEKSIPLTNGLPSRTRMPTPLATPMPQVLVLAQLYDHAPRRDLTQMRPRSTTSMKAGMKPKQQKASLTPRHTDNILTATSLHPPKISSPSKSSSKSGKQMAKRGVPTTAVLKQCYIGVKVLPEKDSDDAYYIAFGNDGKLVIKRGPPGRPSLESISFKVDRQVQSMEFTRPNEAASIEPVIQLKTTGEWRGTTGPPHPDFFRHGSGGQEGRVTLHFPEGRTEEYQALLDWLKDKVKEHSALDTHATRAILTKARDGVTLKETELSRKASGSRPKSPAFSPVLTVHRRMRRSAKESVTLDESLVAAPRTRPRATPAYKEGNKETIVQEPPRRTVASTRPSPPSDPDELLLVYPPSGKGAMNVTRSDLNRLNPGEFLNDTLIEFGLKLWLNNLREKDPTLADQVHIFSSFFYKKLNIRNEEEGYQSVKKWTSKFDLFEKKYIFVPINENLHWYLAIIYQPQHILVAPPLRKEPPSTRAQKRRSDGALVENVKQPRSTTPHDDSPSPSLAKEDEGNSGSTYTSTPSQTQEAEVVTELLHFGSSCSISGGDLIQDPSASSKAQRASDGAELMAIVEEEKDVSVSLPLAKIAEMDVDDPPNHPAGRPSGRTSPTASETADVRREEETAGEEEDLPAPDEDSSLRSSVATSGITAASFYAPIPTSRKGKRKAADDVDKDAGEAAVVASNLLTLHDSSSEAVDARTYIFTLDSLGSKHPQAVRLLRNYLKQEAKDKRGIDAEPELTGKQAQVPTQPNFCDCGIYLLHFVKTFMKNPVGYRNIILNRKPGARTLKKPGEWDESLVGSLREDLKAQIETMSEVWKKERAAKEAAEAKGSGEKVESSDSEVDIVEDVEPMPAPAPRIVGSGKPPPIKGAKRAKAKRMRG